ncbi:hypothetical protein [Streptomyces meridianus]|uniref:Uncharacterized protein n=1 Tax=Streptomyces meridianus TaxID=2938945 RepID=A0ABT0XBL7_9ACTN|nr:hypothetical protein [Streptomyces meridianus]MCM2579333.1 hypothetical protein [Streptomyces meridianus]
MTACAIEAAASSGGTVRTALTIGADGSYAARLVPGGEGCWYPERWTLAGPEPYAVPLPVNQPEDEDCAVLPLSDGRVLIRRRAGEQFVFALLYPSGDGTGEVALGGVGCSEFTLVPQAADDPRVYGLAPGETSTELWLVHDPRFVAPLASGGTDSGGPRRITRLPGRCSGGVRLDRTGDLLAVDQELDGRTKSVVVDLRRGGLVTPLLQLTEKSNDRLLMADPDSGLLIVRSDAPGHDRMGWGVLGSSRPVRFPECLRLPDAAVTPFALQPGQALLPEQCAVALRIDGARGSWVGVWRPCDRRLRQFPAPDGWLTGAGLWTREGELHLPYATFQVPCGLARTTTPALPVMMPSQHEPEGSDERSRRPVPGPGTGPSEANASADATVTGPEPEPAAGPGSGTAPESATTPRSAPAAGTTPITGTAPADRPTGVETGPGPSDPGPGSPLPLPGPATGPVPLQRALIPVRRAS